MLSHPPDLLAVSCPGCNAAIAVASPLFGRPAACPVCGAGFLAPAPDPPHDPEPVYPPIVAAEPPPATIGHGSGAIELRRLSPEEKSARRVRRTMLTVGFGTLFLFAIVLAATRGGKSRRKRR